MSLSRALVLILLATHLGCVPGAEPDGEAPEEVCPIGFVDSPQGCVFDEASIQDLMGDFDAGELVRINREPFLQTVGTPLLRNVWVSPVALEGAPAGPRDAAELYALVDPEEVNGELPADFPVGTVVVHEAVDREEGHGVQVKLGEPVDELGRDWWFGKLYDDGAHDTEVCTPCVVCHTAELRPGTDGLWGVPADAM